jgi:hypothetical protein
LTTLEGIEAASRGHILEHVSPEIGLFCSQQPVAAADEVGNSKAFWEKLASPKSRRKSSNSKLGPN